MISAEKYKNLSERSYNINLQDVTKVIKKERTYYYNNSKKKLGKFKVLAVENNQNNGTQAMAVAPVDSNGEVDTSQIVIAYAGTDKGEYSDLLTDENQVIRGKKTSLEFYELQNPSQYRLPSAKNKLAVDPLISSTMITSPLISTTKKIVTTNQLETSEEFAKKIREEYPYSDINFTGHSLGGYMAIRAAIKINQRQLFLMLLIRQIPCLKMKLSLP